MDNGSNLWKQLKENVIDSNLCSHCGTCVGLNNTILEFNKTPFGPLPFQKNNEELDPATYYACPGKGVPYPAIYDFLHGTEKHNFLSGKVVNSWIGYSTDHNIRLNSASGGVITSTLLYLLNNRLIDGAIVVLSGTPNPEDAVPIIATTEKEIIASAQSVYLPVPVNKILDKSKNFKGKLAFVGLPDQVASIRMLQMAIHPSVSNIEYILGPYTGTNMYEGAIRSFLRGRGVKDSTKISSLKWRAGEWPGYLEVILEDGKVFKAEKFYYNYL
ncbi:MAG: coenzyme F420 hydrogenase/dehydrogenase beta subunit N-terminal domain-containing protein, partial [SAR202 cluster bacterium]|nr:coenzyme F420 hydrogenase/dehydrogenase beta subunit N-terminal domain-containing protein [SAR202 cluster bacterium]